MFWEVMLSFPKKLPATELICFFSTQKGMQYDQALLMAAALSTWSASTQNGTQPFMITAAQAGPPKVLVTPPLLSRVGR